MPFRPHRVTRLLAAALCAAGCARGPRLPAPRTAAPAPDVGPCAAVAAALDSLVPARAGARLALGESAAALPARAYAELESSVPGLDPTAWAAFVARSRAPGPACRTLPTARPVVLVPDRVLRALPGGDPEAYWAAFRRRYPGAAGLTRASAVGESADGRQALLVVSHGCGGVCGGGYVVLLGRGRPGDAWRVRYARMLWVS